LQILDFILIGIMAVSGILALARGFTREVLSLAAWAIAGFAAYMAIQQKPLIDLALPYVDKPLIAQIVVGAAAFIIVLIIASIISVKISDRVVDSAVGAFDRTLGFIYGLGRGLLLVALGFLFYGWLQPKENREDWITQARSLPVIEATSNVLIGAIRRISPDTAETLDGTRLKNPEGSIGTAPAPESSGETGYNNGQTQGLENLVDGQDTKTDQQPQQPAAGQANPQ
jgi:membrane protein required for colicin V production